MAPLLTSREVQQLLHNKYVVIMGDSVQRSVYKDLVLLLQKDCLLTLSQLKGKGELSFEQDELLEGGQLCAMHSGINYQEVRQFCSGHHLVRFYFITRAYSKYLKTILRDLQLGEQPPDLIVMNSCLWDLSRYGPRALSSYLKNLEYLFGHLRQVLPESCLLVWNTTMPVADKIKASFLPANYKPYLNNLKAQVMEANFYSSTEASKHNFDVLDLHFHFRLAQQYRHTDGVHWNEVAHRHLSQLLLAHVAEAWGVDLPPSGRVGKWIKEGPARKGAGQRVETRAGRGALARSRSRPYPQPGPLMHRALLPFPPPSPPPPPPPPPPYGLPPPLLPLPPPHSVPLLQLSPFPRYPPDVHFSPGQPGQPGEAPIDFHSDVPLGPQSGFTIGAEFMLDPQPPSLPYPPPCSQQWGPVVHRGYPRLRPPAPYRSGRLLPRPFKRRPRVHPEPRPQ
ncbi:PC-esterase domain-containing protein 1B [Erinaceus europaeus]|uniref:PC-esterase domain-containing protein 1B n=1 Tax=Erinaceus europaeus TaxID=9365 RepID=A0A1S2ZAA8_ERIEU|nr:PC-esterase domain-containing protein 1B [Erinaceus europaeus]XP_060051479.1 PC-esterase domain-containing protein 1B [Erinaceus europaeus]XP_060051480.1 PC-esterase domain-containing protein 1B [Erinaceus europaeus]